MSREEIKTEYGSGVGTLSWMLGLVPGEDDAPTWSFGLDENAPRPGGFPPVSCGVCCKPALISMHAAGPVVGVLGRLSRTDPKVALHDPLGAAWSSEYPPCDMEVVL